MELFCWRWRAFCFLLVQMMGLWWVALVFKTNRKPIKGFSKSRPSFWRQIYRRVSKVMQGKSDKIHEHPHSLFEPCKKSNRGNVLSGIGRDFWRDFWRAPFFLEAGRGQFLNDFFYFRCEIAGNFWIFFIKLLRPVDFYFNLFFVHQLLKSCARSVFHQIKPSNFQSFYFPLGNCLKSASSLSSIFAEITLQRFSKNWDSNDSFWARSPNFSPQIQVLRRVDALSKLDTPRNAKPYESFLVLVKTF